jgi:ubiquinone/menaquinone biosynthesis C-methylase UbiE
VHFQQASAEDLPFDDDSASAIISVASIKHWPNQHKRLAEMIRVLRPGGLLLILELDRGCSLADARDFMVRCRYPRFLQWPAVVVFRTFVAGQSIDLEEARELIHTHPLDEIVVQRISPEPLLQLAGRKKTDREIPIRPYR